MHRLLAVSDALEKLCRGAGRLGAWMIAPLILIIMYDVITRKIPGVQQWVLNSPLYDYISPTKLQEAEWHLHAVIFLLAWGMAYLTGAHVRVDLWRETRSARTRGWAELIMMLLIALPYCATLVWVSVEFAWNSFQQGEGSSALTGIPHRWVIKTFLPLGAILLSAALLSTLIRLVVYLAGGEETRAQALRRLGMLADPAPTSEGAA